MGGPGSKDSQNVVPLIEPNRILSSFNGCDLTPLSPGEEMDAQEESGNPEDPRIRFAAERTLLAWIRTGITVMGFGFVVARFGFFLRELKGADVAATQPTGLSLWMGVLLITAGVAMNALSGIEHHRFLKRLARKQAYETPRWSLAIIVSIAMALLGIGLAAYVVSAGR